MAFQCTIVTPEEQVLDEPIVQAIIPAHDGKTGILTDRAPLLTKIGVGELRLDLPGNRQRRFLIEGGVAQMKDNRLTILTSAAIPEEKIDAESARAELAEATARRITDQQSFDDRQRDMDRARAKIEIATR